MSTDTLALSSTMDLVGDPTLLAHACYMLFGDECCLIVLLSVIVFETKIKEKRAKLMILPGGK